MLGLLAPKSVSSSSSQTWTSRLSKPLPPQPGSLTLASPITATDLAKSAQERQRVRSIIPKAELARQLDSNRSTPIRTNHGPVPPRRSWNKYAQVSAYDRSVERPLASDGTTASGKGARARSMGTATTEVYGSDIIRHSPGRKVHDKMRSHQTQQRLRQSVVAAPLSPSPPILTETKEHRGPPGRAPSGSSTDSSSWQSDIIDQYILSQPLGARMTQARLLEGFPRPPSTFLPRLRLSDKASTEEADIPNFYQIGENTLDLLAKEVVAGFVVSGGDHGKIRGRPVGLVRGPRLPPPSQRRIIS